MSTKNNKLFDLTDFLKKAEKYYEIYINENNPIRVATTDGDVWVDDIPLTKLKETDTKIFSKEDCLSCIKQLEELYGVKINDELGMQKIDVSNKIRVIITKEPYSPEINITIRRMLTTKSWIIENKGDLYERYY